MDKDELHNNCAVM